MFNWNLPFTSVTVPIVVLSTNTLAAIIGSPFSSTIVPVTFFTDCCWSVWLENSAALIDGVKQNNPIRIKNK